MTRGAPSIILAKPVSPLEVFAQGVLLHEQGRLRDAERRYETVLEADKRHFGALFRLGLICLADRRYEDAESLFRRAARSDKDSADAHHNLGIALTGLGRFEEAIKRYEKAVALRPNFPEAHNNLGHALDALGRTKEAIAHYEKAIGLNPAYEEAHSNLGAAAMQLGKLEIATRAFETAVDLAPRNAGNYWDLANLKRLAADDRHFITMTGLARETPSSLAPDDRIKLHFAVAKALADQGDREGSFVELVRGNSLKRQQIEYDEASTLNRLERIQKLFSPALMNERAGFGDPSPLPIFIVGMPRSGTTLVEQVMASHPAVYGAGELYNLSQLAIEARGPDESTFPENVAAMPGKALRHLGRDYVRSIKPLAPTAQRVTDKMPANFALLGLIHLALPNARIVHTRRDLRDTALSCFSVLFTRGQSFTYDLAELGRYCRAYETLMGHWRNVLPAGVMLEVDYEELVADFDRHARRIVAHCGLEWNDACLSFQGTSRSVRTASATQVRQPIYRSSVGRWRAYEKELGPLLQELNR